MDPFFRTIKGFEVLIEKEFCSFASRFLERHIRQKDIIPVFFEFLDVVYQIQTQFPTAFEYNSRLLIACFDHVQFGLYGTFLYDREEDKIKVCSII